MENIYKVFLIGLRIYSGQQCNSDPNCYNIISQDDSICMFVLKGIVLEFNFFGIEPAFLKASLISRTSK